MASLRTFLDWGKRLDTRVLGPSGWLPANTSYGEYRRALLRASDSPTWVRVSYWLGLLALLPVVLFTGPDDHLGLHVAVIPVALLVGGLSFKIDRDIRVAARQRAMTAASR